MNLDQRKLKTTMGDLFSVPTRTLALAVANEWNAQETHIKKHTMHLVGKWNSAMTKYMEKS